MVTHTALAATNTDLSQPTAFGLLGYLTEGIPMKKQLTLSTKFCLIASLILLSACSSNQRVDTDLGIRGAPDWVNEGTQVVDNNDGQLIYGVGMAPAMNDQSLQKSTADNRARAEIARILKTYIDSTLKDYSASSNNGDNSANSMSIERDIRSTSQLALSGARILGHWKDPRTEDIYAFSVLDTNKLDELIAKATNLSDDFKHFFEQNSQQSFQRFIETNHSEQ